MARFSTGPQTSFFCFTLPPCALDIINQVTPPFLPRHFLADHDPPRVQVNVTLSTLEKHPSVLKSKSGSGHHLPARK